MPHVMQHVKYLNNSQHLILCTSTCSQSAITSLYACLQEREATLAALLRQRLVPHVTGDAAAFKDAVDKETHELAALPFGIAMLHCIG